MIGIIAHAGKPGAAPAARRAAAALQKRGATILADSATARLARLPDGGSVSELASRCELLVVLGGDGTILRVAHQIPGPFPVIFGINIGSLGFLTCMGPSEIETAAQSIVDKNFALSPRRLLRVTLRAASGQISHFEALNDVVISRGERSQLVKLRVWIDGSPLTDYYADGLIIATPTGSTAYSLSAGGPILMPTSGCLVITPICPHVLTNRSVVVGERSLITLRRSGSGTEQIFLAEDGHDARPLGPDDEVQVRRSRRVLPLAMLPGRHFSDVLSQKLKWSGSNI